MEKELEQMWNKFSFEYWDNVNNKSVEVITKEDFFDAMKSYAQNLNKHLVMQGLPTENEIERWVKEHGYYGHCTQEYHEGLEEGARWVISKMSSGPTVGKAGEDASVSDGK